MGFVVGLIGIILASYCYYTERKIMCPGFLFSLYWGFLCILSGMRLNGLNEVDGTIYVIVLIGMLSFVFGTLCGNKVVFKKMLKQEGSITINKGMLDVLFLILLIGYLMIDITVLKLILSGIRFSTIRYNYLDQVFGTYAINVIYKFLMTPLTWAYIVSFFCSIYATHKINTKFLLKALLLSLLEFVATSGRTIMMLWVVGTFVTYLFLRQNISKRMQKKLRRILLIFVIGIISVILARGGSVVNSLYIYFVGSLNFFSHRIGDMRDFTFGVSSFQGLLRPVMGVLEKIGVSWHLFERANEFLLSNQYTAVRISENGKVFNYFISCFGYFYNDAGILGVILFSFIWGTVSSSILKKVKRYQDNVLYFGEYIFIVYSIFMSMMNFLMAETSFAWGLCFFALLCVKKVYIKNEKVVNVDD